MSLGSQYEICFVLDMPPSFLLHKQLSTREGIKVIKGIKDTTKSNAKTAFLSARRKERIKLPTYRDSYTGKVYPINEFLNHPTGIEAMLNINALESWEVLSSNTYRCRLPKIQLLSFEVSPSMVLQVNPTSEDCIVEMLSCKFEGSDIVERQNRHFSAFMKNQITWDTNAGSESFLNVDVNLKVQLEIYNQPFLLLPVSAVEIPGNVSVIYIGHNAATAIIFSALFSCCSIWISQTRVLICRAMQALLDRFVPLLLQQLLQDYENWVQGQCKASS